MSDWKAEIVRMAHWKQLIADHDPSKAYPWHFPGVAATDDAIAAAERTAGSAFPAQYKDFLRHANGWRGLFVAADLFGTQDFVEGRCHHVMQRPELRQFIEGLGLDEKSVAVIGASDPDGDVFLLVSPYARTLPGGVLWYADEEIDRFESFAEFFGSMVNYNAGIAKRLASGSATPG